MQHKVRRWFDALPLSDPLERQQAGLLQVMLLTILGGCAIGLLISVITSAEQSNLTIGIIAYTILISFADQHHSHIYPDRRRIGAVSRPVRHIAARCTDNYPGPRAGAGEAARVAGEYGR